MKRDGMAFVAIMLIIAFIGNTLGTLITAIASFAFSIIGVRVVCEWLKGVKLAPGETPVTWDTPARMTESVVPSEFSMLEELVLNRLKQTGDDYKALLGRFLHAINVHDGSRHIPSYFNNGVVKKMLWEYSRRFGSFDYPKTRNTIQPGDITRPIADTERDAFHEFCVQQTL